MHVGMGLGIERIRYALCSLCLSVSASLTVRQTSSYDLLADLVGKAGCFRAHYFSSPGIGFTELSARSVNIRHFVRRRLTCSAHWREGCCRVHDGMDLGTGHTRRALCMRSLWRLLKTGSCLLCL